jgi:hypothetical protein
MSSLVYCKNKSNGVTYVYENISTWNKETKKCDTKRKCIGELNPITKEVIPTGKPGKGKGDAAYAEVRCVGDSIILDKVANNLALAQILEKTLPEEKNRILACAYYLISDGQALSHIETWSARNANPFGKVLTSQRVSDLLKELTPEKQMGFFRSWAASRSESEYVAMDITSVSSYSEQNEYVRFGYNRDKEYLPQINLCVLLGEESGVPIYFECLNGSIKDVSALENVIKALDWFAMKKLHIVMDRGFYSERNIDGLYARHIRFTIGAPFTAGWVKEIVSAVRGGIEDFAHYHRIGGNTLFADTDTADWKGYRCYRHIYYDSRKAASEYADFLERVDAWKSELEDGHPVAEHQRYYDKYFTVKETPKRGRRVSPRDDAIQEFKQRTAGFFVLVSNDIKDPVKALKIYRDKDAVEKGFDDLKNALDMKRLRIHSPDAMKGRLFVQFIAQILASGIRNTMNSAELNEKYTLPELMNEMKSFNRVSVDGRRKSIFSKLSKAQAEILSAFDIKTNSYV